jgi:dienelactone hydrolase
MDRLTWHAERFAGANIAALLFDYRSFGESGGEPRQLVEIAGQQDDIRAAVRFARSCERIDPDQVALWGSSLGGGHVITVAAGDPKIAAVVAQIPHNGFPKRVEGRRLRDTVKLTAAMLWDYCKGKLGLEPFYIPMVAAPGELAVVSSNDAQRHMEQLTGGPTAMLWRNAVAPRALIAMMGYKPSLDAPNVRAPLLVCAAEADRETPLDLVRPLAELAPHGELRVYPGTHFDFYGNSELRDRILRDQIEFLRRRVVCGP